MNNSVEKGKTIAIIAYMTIIGSVIAIIMNNDEKNTFASFHNRQGLGTWLTLFILGYPVGYFDSWTITLGLYIFIFVLWMYGFLGALQGKMNITPILGPLYQKVFKSL